VSTCRRQRSELPRVEGPHVVTIRVRFLDGDIGLYEIFTGDEADAERIWLGIDSIYFEQGRQVDHDRDLDIALLSRSEWDAFLASVGAS
jgi:hypothetical protein